MNFDNILKHQELYLKYSVQVIKVKVLKKETKHNMQGHPCWEVDVLHDTETIHLVSLDKEFPDLSLEMEPKPLPVQQEEDNGLNFEDVKVGEHLKYLDPSFEEHEVEVLEKFKYQNDVFNELQYCVTIKLEDSDKVIVFSKYKTFKTLCKQS